MSKTKLRAVLAFALIITLLLASCQQPMADPQEPEPEYTYPIEELAPIAEEPEPEPTEPEPTEPLAPTYEIYQFGGYDWRILDVQEDGRMFLLSRYVITRAAYHDRNRAPSWETSSLRHWLNTEFYESFSEEDRARIVLTTLETPPIWNDTEDFIFLLSHEEVDEYLHAHGLVDYQRLDGVEISWWLRSPLGTTVFRSNISTRIHYFSGMHGVRPALWLEPDDAADLPTVQAWQPWEPPPSLGVLEPWETQAMEWPELFATVVGRLADEAFLTDLDDDPEAMMSWMFTNPLWFTIMDMNFNGEPQLLIGASFINSHGFYVFSINDAEQFLQSDSFTAYLATYQLRLFGEEPLRFFKNDETDTIIFSQLMYSFGGAVVRTIFYTDANTLERHGSIQCSGSLLYPEHEHSLRCANHELVKTLPGAAFPREMSFSDMDWLQDWPCDIDLGRNSSDPSVVTLVNMVLEGFTELPRPQQFRFPERFGWIDRDYRPFGANSDDVQNVQNWIFEVAAQWGEVDPAVEPHE